MYVIDSTNDGAKVPRNKAKNLATPQEENLRSESGGNKRDREKERDRQSSSSSRLVVAFEML